MNLAQLKDSLAKHSELSVRFQLPNGDAVPAHAHVTEVARIDKKFVDCGGTFRSQSTCRLQTWVSDDFHHRLKAGTLSKVLEKGDSFLQTGDIEVDVEHELDYLTQFPLASAEPNGTELLLRLAERHTECLAPEKCKPKPSILDDPNLLKLQFTK
jgi:hypothetical protein